MRFPINDTVDVFHWNPRVALVPGRLGRILKGFGRIDNFGDLLGPLLVTELLRQRGIALPSMRHSIVGWRRRQLLTVGSILHFATDGDIVWGSGCNGKIPEHAHRFEHLDVRMVRGPLTREFLRRRGIPAPEIYGDPGLLLPILFPELDKWRQEPRFDVTFVPNFNDPLARAAASLTIEPRRPFWEIVERIARSRFVASSSLHGIIVAESMGIPARYVQAAAEPEFKYRDHYLGTGRDRFTAASSVEEAVAMGGEPPAVFSPEAMLATFPWDVVQTALPPPEPSRDFGLPARKA